MGWLDDLARRLAGAARDEERRKAFEQATARPKATEEALDRAAPYLSIAGLPYVRIAWGAERGSLEDPGACPSCKAQPGELHRLGCGAEECPNCGAKAMTCGCRFGGEHA
jgi:hypothetical protein